MGGRGRQAVPVGGGSDGAKRANYSSAKLQKEVEKEFRKLPKHLRETLENHGLKTRVVSSQELKDILGEDTPNDRGLYDGKSRTAFIVSGHFQYEGALQNIRMTALHEWGHGLDHAKGLIIGRRLSQTTEFRDAVRKDRKNFKNRNLTEKEKWWLRFRAYNKKPDRYAEVFAEGMAVLLGPGRTKPAKNWNNSELFHVMYPTVLKFIVQRGFR